MSSTQQNNIEQNYIIQGPAVQKLGALLAGNKVNFEDTF